VASNSSFFFVPSVPLLSARTSWFSRAGACAGEECVRAISGVFPHLFMSTLMVCVLFDSSVLSLWLLLSSRSPHKLLEAHGYSRTFCIAALFLSRRPVASMMIVIHAVVAAGRGFFWRSEDMGGGMSPFA